MPVTYVSAGTAASGTTSAAPGYPSGIAAGSLIVACIGNKPFGSTVTQPANFTDRGSISDGGVAGGNGTGSTRSTVMSREATDALTGTQTFSVISASPTMGQMVHFTKDAGETWDLVTYPLFDSMSTLTAVDALINAAQTVFWDAASNTGSTAVDTTPIWQSFVPTVEGVPTRFNLNGAQGVVIGGTPSGDVVVEIADAATGGNVLATGTNPAASAGALFHLTGTGVLSTSSTYYIRLYRTDMTTGTVDVAKSTTAGYASGAASDGGDWAYFQLWRTTAATDIAAGDRVVVAVTITDDVPTHTSQEFTIPGCTLGTMIWLTRISTTSGGDGAMYVGVVSVTAGSATGAPRYTATSSVSGKSACPVMVTRVRATGGAPPTEAAMLLGVLI